jgi:hypothetical protein
METKQRILDYLADIKLDEKEIMIISAMIELLKAEIELEITRAAHRMVEESINKHFII